MKKKAAIYVRTSSEQQAEKSSPEEQERDCRAIAQDNNLEVYHVYRDIERYRVRQKMVDPSGTRADRPGMLAMLEDASVGRFDVIIAWKEDRLYRALRPMLMVLDTIKKHDLEIILVKEHFDTKMAPLKAWMAELELDAIKERMTMGVKARLRAGKANTGQDRYGYERVGDEIIVVEEEAKWVRQIFDWYVAGVPVMKIRDKLIAANAPQKGSSVPRKTRWARSSIHSILRAAKQYARGIKIQTRAGETFEIPVEPLISEETYQAAVKRRKANTTRAKRNVKRDYLLRGLIQCSCPRSWGARQTAYRSKARPRKKPTGCYYCTQTHKEKIDPTCSRTIGSKKADDYVWSKVKDVLNNPEFLLSKARERVARLQHEVDSTRQQAEEIQAHIARVGKERQWVITQARIGRISDQDMEGQLQELETQEAYLRRELSEHKTMEELSCLDNWEEAAREWLEDLRVGIQWLDTPAQNATEKKERFALKRQIVLALVNNVNISGQEKNLEVVFKFDVFAFLKGEHPTTLPESTKPTDLIEMGGTCSRKRSSPRPRLRGACG
ncbi:MAG: recombinase family protein [Anaerolineales bacterium]|nr:recombinase family protein [Anaerolineales bacterium]